MATIVIEGVDPALNGEYEFDFRRRRTARELWIYKQVARHGWDEMGAAEREGNEPLIVAGLATLALIRAGKIEKAQALHFGERIFDLGENDDDGMIRLIVSDADKAAPDNAAAVAEDGDGSIPPAPELAEAGGPSGKPEGDGLSE